MNVKIILSLCFYALFAVAPEPDSFLDDILSDKPVSLPRTLDIQEKNEELVRAEHKADLDAMKSAGLQRVRETQIPQFQADDKSTLPIPEPKLEHGNNTIHFDFGDRSDTSSDQGSVGPSITSEDLNQSIANDFKQSFEFRSDLENLKNWFSLNFENDNPENALKYLKKYIDSKANKNGLLTFVLESQKISIENKNLFLKLFIKNGMRPKTLAITKVINQYTDYTSDNFYKDAKSQNLKIQKSGFVSRVRALMEKLKLDKSTVNLWHKYLKDYWDQRARWNKAKKEASLLAENIFLLDQAARKGVVTLDQRRVINKIEKEHKNVFQRTFFWFKRTLKSFQK